MSEVLKICGIAVLTIALSAALKSLNSSVSTYLPQISAIVIFISAITALIPVISFIKELSHGVNIKNTYVSILVLAGAISIISKIVADLCKENGQEMLKNAVEFAANAEILLLCIPLIRQLLILSNEVLKL